MEIRTAAIAVALALGMTLANAQPTEKDCVAIPEKLDRLDCYDKLHHRAPDPAPGTQPERLTPRPGPTLTERWDLDGRKSDLFWPTVYRPVYILFANWTNRTNPEPSSPSPGHSETSPFTLSAVEAKYQLSLKSKFWQFDNGVSVWGAYTQSSRWQVYNAADSRPFRETNYEPEVIVVKPLLLPFASGNFRMASLAFNHQSNGRALPLSRSWNRMVGALVYENGDWTVEARPWWRWPEDPSSDDNPDISDYAGRGELRITRRFGKHLLSTQLRHSLRSGSRSHGSVQVDYVFPVPWLHDTLHGQLQVFSGYAESLIDYNVRQTRVGFGFTIAGWQ